jgi:hypothetical protein
MTQYTSASCDCSIQEHTHEGTPEQPFSEELLVLREFTHRVNNELASAIAAISLVANPNYSPGCRLSGDERDVIHWNHVMILLSRQCRSHSHGNSRSP